MTPEHQRLREALGAYVLGALDPGERREVERHLTTCPECADELVRLGPLAGLLGRVSEHEIRADLLRPPDTLLDGVIAELADHAQLLRTRVQRWRAATVAAALIALLVTAAALLPGDRRDDGAPDRTVAPIASAAEEADVTTGQAAAIAWEWGTTVELQLADLPSRDGYVLWAVADDGRRERAGTWGPTSSGAAKVRGASSIHRSELARVEVTDRDGRVLLTFDFTDAPEASRRPRAVGLPTPLLHV